MAAVSGAIPNVIGGVSQQPTEIRALNTSTALVNTRSDVATGLSTRPFGGYIGEVGPAPSGAQTVASHKISKVSGRYEVSVYGGQVYVIDLDTGQKQTVTVEGGAGSYINTTDAAANIGFVTVGDTTFIYNRKVTVSAQYKTEGSGTNGNWETGITRKNPNRHSTVWVQQKVGYDRWLALYQNGDLFCKFMWPNDWTAGGAASKLRQYTSTYTSPSASGGSYYTDGVEGPLATSEVSTTVFTITLKSESNWFSFDDDHGKQTMTVVNDKVQEFADLPSGDIEGRLILVSQDRGEDSDDYWVWYKNGFWEETYGWNAYEKPNNSTMPVILVDNRNGTWTLKRTDWPGRTVGDADSNPTPTFIGRTINHMFVHKGRMCILSDENFIASRVGDFENFYRRTCTQLLDDDPIDVASPEGGGGPVFHAAEFDNGLLLFSALDQFKITGDGEGLLSPNTVMIRHANSYNCSSRVSPIFVGPNILFADDYGTRGYAAFREYQIERVFGREIAPAVTDQVPEYIPAGVYSMSGSSTDNVIIALTTGDRRSAWVYNYYFNTEGKVQSAWQRWEFPGPVYAAGFDGDRLIVHIVYGGKLRLMSFTFDAGADMVLDKDSVLLDLRVDENASSVTYDGEDSRVSLPYPIAPADLERTLLVISPENTGTALKGQVYIPSSVSGSTLVFPRVDLRNQKFLVGLAYRFYWRLSPIFMRDNNLVAIQDGRLQLRKVSLLYNNSGPFKTHFTPTGGRQSYTSEFTGWNVGSADTLLGIHSLHSGSFRVSVNGAAEDMDLVVEAWTPWRVRFSSIEWDGRWRPSKRRTT